MYIYQRNPGGAEVPFYKADGILEADASTNETSKETRHTEAKCMYRRIQL